MLVPMLLGYLVGSAGIYFLLYKMSPVVAEDYVAQNNAPESDERVEIIELFPMGSPEDQVKAA